MASDRDALAQLIAQELDFHYSIDSDNCEPIEAGIKAGCAAALAKGWRPPARVITTLDDLLSLPVGAVVRSSAGTIACRADLAHGVVFGDERPFSWVLLALPATVIPIPTEEATA